MKIDDQGNIHDGSGKFAGHVQGEGDADQVLAAEPAPGERYAARREVLNSQLDDIERQRDRAYAKLNTYAFADVAAQVLADHPEATSMTLLSWAEESPDGGAYDVTHGAILDAAGNELGEAPEGCMSSTQLQSAQPWEAAYIERPDKGDWGGTLDLHKLVEIGEQVGEANRVDDHIQQICEEAGYGTMADILQVSRERGDLEDETYLAVTAADLEGLWDGYVGPAIDDVERSIRGDYD